MPGCAAAHRSLPFFFNDTATTEIYTLSLHDALPICIDSCLNMREVADPFGAFRTNIVAKRSEEHTSELQSHSDLVCRLLLGKEYHTSELQSHNDLVCSVLLETHN